MSKLEILKQIKLQDSDIINSISEHIEWCCDNQATDVLDEGNAFENVRFVFKYIIESER